MSTTIYRPYFYIIQHINSSKYYAGVKHGLNANPDNLLKSNGYKTSSVIIKNIILEEGVESFVIRKVKTFETGDQALDYESRFLRRVNASFNDNFLNRSNNSISNLNVDYEKRKQTNLLKFGYECSLQNEEVKEKSKQTCLEKYGCDSSNKSEEVKNKIKQSHLERYGVENLFQLEEIREKSKQTMLERHGFEYAMQSEEVKEKSKQTMLERHGFEYAMQSEEVKEKYKKNFLRNHGVENPSQSPEVQEKKRQNRIALHNRPTVIEIRKYRDEFKLKLGKSWIWKPQEFLDDLLTEIKNNYETL